jgi:arginase
MVLLIGIGSGMGAGDKGCGEGPLFLQEHPQFVGCQHEWVSLLTGDKSIQNPYEHLKELYSRVARKTYELAAQDQFFIVIGGDHSCAIGTWSGISEAMRPKGPIGLIWFDAHMDSHTPQTSESGNIHGMPLAALMGFGDERLTQILSKHPKINPAHVVLIGIRSFEKEEAALLKKLGVSIYFIDEVRKGGLKRILNEAIDYLRSKTVGFGVSFDLDSIDPQYAMGVGTPVDIGIDLNELIDTLDLFQKFPPIAFEIVEYNPYLDTDFATVKIIGNILQKISPRATSFAQTVNI